MGDTEIIVIIKLANGEQFNIICSDYCYEKESNDYRFEDELGIVHAIVPREQVVCIYEEKYRFK